MPILWILTAFATVPATATLLWALAADSAPKQAAGAAVAVALVVIPYVFTRAVAAVAAKPVRREDVAALLDALGRRQAEAPAAMPARTSGETSHLPSTTYDAGGNIRLS